MNVAELLNAAARQFPASPAIVSGTSVRSTYRELADHVAARADAMARLYGIGPGKRVALYAGNSTEYLEILFAIWWAGATAIPLSSMLHAREVHALLEDSAASLCVASADTAVGLEGDSNPGCPIILPADIAPAGACDSTLNPPCEADPSDPAWIFYTSGTTGTPKGALLSHGNLMAMTLAYLADVEPVDERSGLLHLALMSHAGGLFSLPFIARGARQVIPASGGFDPSETWTLLTESDHLSFFAPPVILRRLVAAPEAATADVSRMGTVLVGAAPVLVNDLVTGVGVFGARIWNGYGQGETPCTITALDARAIGAAVAQGDLDLLRSVGFPRIGIEVRVVDADDRVLPDGEAGEIIVRGPTVMSEYLNRPEATAETLRGGWLHTGDIGMFNNGALTLLDRSKDLVITGGANVYPREVEDVLILHASVADVAVIGVPDDEWGERVIAFIVPSPDQVLEVQQLQRALEDHCLSSMARYKRPKEYHLVSQLPRNGAGKVLKSELRATLLTSETKE
jgi:long-chain acyl-CoA synthetase